MVTSCSPLGRAIREEQTPATATRGVESRAECGSRCWRYSDRRLDSIRDLELRLSALEQAQAACATPALPVDPSASPNKPMWLEEANVPQVIDVYRRLIVAAFACDITRVITLNLASDGGAYRMNPWVEGINAGVDWHGSSTTSRPSLRETGRCFRTALPSPTTNTARTDRSTTCPFRLVARPTISRTTPCCRLHVGTMGVYAGARRLQRERGTRRASSSTRGVRCSARGMQ